MSDKKLKTQWKRYTQGRREALKSVDVIHVTLPIPEEAKQEILALIQPWTDRVRLLSILVGVTPYDRALTVGLLQSLNERLTIDEVETVIHFRRKGVSEEEARDIISRHGLPSALTEFVEEAA